MFNHGLKDIDPRFFQEAVAFVQEKYRYKSLTSMVREEIYIDFRGKLLDILEEHVLPDYFVDSFEVMVQSVSSDGYPQINLIIKEF